MIVRWGRRYLGICKEFGFVEDGETPEEVQKKLINGSVALLKAVYKEPRLEPSLNFPPPFKYLLIYYFAPIMTFFLNIFNLPTNLRLFSESTEGLLKYA